ncbi:MAG: DUF2975 domain-containing protein [Ignavibacteriales bacterium]|jgi:hypothetical protein|nr:DUF2975 domain-containing protein [Ignavibacteriales bacterium]
MSKTNNFVFWSLYTVAWLIFVGLSIEGGGLIINFIYSLYKPEVVQNLYQKLDMMPILRESKMVFFGLYSFILSIAILKAILFYFLIVLMHKMDRKKPFSTFVSKQISKVSYLTLSIGVLGYIAQGITRNLNHHNFNTSYLDQFWADSKAFILMGAVIYIIATIFQKGVEIQSENDLIV